ncbi:MAG TPA: DUF192 domain-containing protein [bacterium]|nr:DUF192 domain-containing protein [bacterium]
MAEGFFIRFRGLMARGRWPSTWRGIYFPRCASVHTFFTFLKPDILFLDKNLKILKIFPSAAPWRIFLGPSGSRHCLEVPGGSARRLKLKNGVKIKF